MSNVFEIVKGDRKVSLSKEFLPLYGAVLSNLRAKSGASTRFAVLKDANVAKVLQASKITTETQQVAEISKCFVNLQTKGFIMLSGDKVQTASFVSETADLAQEVIEQAGKIELSAPTTAKRGRPAGSGAGSQGSVKRNPAPAKGKRFSLVGGKVVQWTIGKPSKNQRLTECDEKGKIIADIAAINAAYAAKEAEKSMKVKRNPTQAANLRYYLLNGTVTPFGRGKPSFDKLNNECTQAGEKIDNSARVAAMRQPKSSGGNSSKVNQLEAQLTEMREMMAKMMLAMGAGAAIAAPAAAVAAEVPAKTAETKVEPAKPAKVKEEKPKAEKPAKSKPSKPAAPKAPKVEKVKASAALDEADAYEGYASVSNDLGDDEPLAFGSDGFLVTDLD